MTGDEFDPDPRPARPWLRGAVIWGLVLYVALVAYELTANPALAVVTVSLKMGWGRFATAAWLWRRDPVRPRGRAAFWFYLGAGFWVAAVTGFVLFLLIPNVDRGRAAGAGNNVAVEAFLGAAIAWGAGTNLAAVCFLIAARLAAKGGYRLWLHADVVRACDRDEWPPLRGDANRAAFPVCVSVVFLFVTVGNVAAVALLEAVGGIGPAPNPWVGIGFFAWVVVLFLGALKVCDRIRTRVYATYSVEAFCDG